MRALLPQLARFYKNAGAFLQPHKQKGGLPQEPASMSFAGATCRR
jgi:hypothetical protein